MQGAAVSGDLREPAMNNKIRFHVVSAVLACALATAATVTLAQEVKAQTSTQERKAQPSAQQRKAKPSREPLVKERLVFAVNEGATTAVTHVELLQRYAGLADAMENALRRPIKVEVYPDT